MSLHVTPAPELNLQALRRTHTLKKGTKETKPAIQEETRERKRFILQSANNPPPFGAGGGGRGAALLLHC